LRLHANENIESEIVAFLRAAGHDVAYAAELMPRAPDESILRIAASEDRVVLTGDKDFGELCFRRRLPSAGVILVRVKAVSPAARIRLIDELLRTHADRLPGQFTVLSDAGVRMRRLWSK
jgi:predicted nuclease of predicted toxin-antitoxin system